MSITIIQQSNRSNADIRVDHVVCRQPMEEDVTSGEESDQMLSHDVRKRDQDCQRRWLVINYLVYGVDAAGQAVRRRVNHELIARLPGCLGTLLYEPPAYCSAADPKTTYYRTILCTDVSIFQRLHPLRCPARAAGLSPRWAA